MNKVTQKQLKERQKRLTDKATKSERVFRARLASAGIHFEFQKIFHPYIVDFYIPYWNTVFEIDGKIHDNRKDYDNKRDAVLAQRGLKIIRIKNEDVKYFDLSEFIIEKKKPLILKTEEDDKRYKESRGVKPKTKKKKRDNFNKRIGSKNRHKSKNILDEFDKYFSFKMSQKPKRKRGKIVY